MVKYGDLLILSYWKLRVMVINAARVNCVTFLYYKTMR